MLKCLLRVKINFKSFKINISPFSSIKLVYVYPCLFYIKFDTINKAMQNSKFVLIFLKYLLCKTFRNFAGY